MMRRIAAVLFVILLIYVFTSAGASLSYFLGYPEDNKVILEWKTASEFNLKGFEIQRSTDRKQFFKLGFLEPKGNGYVYKFVDSSVFVKTSDRVYSYRLKILNIDGSYLYSETIDVVPRISSAKETWGSIKALFK
ncbi:MAG: hypothetical protein ACE5QV_09950 [Fidelibacterota bacterium]|jgi:hypothetical protein